MITQKITGGLGNQMFQYAYGKALSLRHTSPVQLDISGFEEYKLHKYCLEFFDIDKNYAQVSDIPIYEKRHSNNKYINFLLMHIKGIAKGLNKNHHIEKQFNFNPDFLDSKDGYVEGYFQTEQYFIDYADEIRQDFTFAIPPSTKNQETLELINNCNAVSIHIRRGDYVTNDTTNRTHGTCDLFYYKQAIELIKYKVENPVFFFFSDDIDRVKENLKIEDKSYYVDWNDAETNYEDMRLMSRCKHNVIANSSFSWRGAWLNNNPKKIIIAPNRWFETSTLNYEDVVPKNWMKI